MEKKEWKTDILWGLSERNKMSIYCRQRKEITTSSGIQAMMYLWWFPCSLFLSVWIDWLFFTRRSLWGKKWREKESWIYIRISMTHLTQKTRSTLINSVSFIECMECVTELMAMIFSSFCEKKPFIIRVTSEVFVSWSFMIEFWCVFYWWERKITDVRITFC